MCLWRYVVGRAHVLNCRANPYMRGFFKGAKEESDLSAYIIRMTIDDLYPKRDDACCPYKIRTKISPEHRAVAYMAVAHWLETMDMGVLENGFEGGREG